MCKDNLIKIYEETKSINATAKKLGISWGKCKNLLLQHNVLLYKNRNQYGEYNVYNFFEKIQSEEDAYWLGIMYSDGWIRSDRNAIGLGSIDLDLIEKFQKYTGCTNKILVKEKDYNVGKWFVDGHVIKSSKPFYILEFCSKKTKENLGKLGCVPAKSKILTCPLEEQVPNNLLIHFARGYWDGDGWVTWKDGRYSTGCVGTKQFLEGLTNKLKIHHYGKIREKENNIFEFRIDKKVCVKSVLDKLYKNSKIYLDRKYNNYLLSDGA